MFILSSNLALQILNISYAGKDDGLESFYLLVFLSLQIQRTQLSKEIQKHLIVCRRVNLINNQDAWDDLLKKKTTMNMRKSTLTPEDTEGQETAPAPEDVGEEFNMPVDGAGEGAAPAGEGGGAPAKPKGNGRGRNSKKDQPPADNGESADAGEGAAPAGEGAAPGDGEDLGL